MGDKAYKLTTSQGQYLLQLSAVASIPEKMGEEKYSPVDRAIIQGLIGQLFDKLKQYSPFAQEYEPGKNVKLFFGPKDNWKQENPESTRWFMADPKQIAEVRLSKEEANGAAWVCFAVLVPKTGEGTGNCSPSEAIETVWPILRVLGKAEGVAEQLGFKKYDNKKHGWNDDPAATATAIAEPAEKL